MREAQARLREIADRVLQLNNEALNIVKELGDEKFVVRARGSWYSGIKFALVGPTGPSDMLQSLNDCISELPQADSPRP